MIKTVRCAIYTRKSDADGLEQGFNSLDAQREACAAYILSQKHEGWAAVPDFYDDGGFPGGNMARPGLKQLLDDVRTGKVNVIVVYKVDRLTRSLADFAKIVEVLDGAGASFVSVTQSFNTTTSMGRLTLNVLLSFAQFEREVTGERIRDKIAASKRKGMWMGGNPPLGYDVKDRQLVVNEAEAETVRHMMRRYIALGSVRALQEELGSQGICTKLHKGRGGIPFTRGSLGHLLKNTLYLGEVHFKGQVHAGQHNAIVDRKLWDAVQATLARSAVDHRHGQRAKEPSLLSGLLYDMHGGRMTPSHAVKNGQRYRYYITLADHRQDGRSAARVAAQALEDAVAERLAGWLLAHGHDQLLDAEDLAEAMFRAQREADELRTGAASNKREIILRYVQRVDLGEQCFSILLSGGRAVEPRVLTAAFKQVRVGNDLKLLMRGTEVSQLVTRDEQLVLILADARAAQQLAIQYPDKSASELAATIGRSIGRFKRLLRLSYLAPAIYDGILAGREPPALRSPAVHKVTNIPLLWSDQARLLKAS
jgi:DNA invertase Pin-like site-specific DNA recombinase